MVVRGRVHNGVVVFADDVHLSEGQEVMILASSPTITDGHGILEIAPVSLGSVLRPFSSDDDLLGEMPEGRP